ncbi:hypothetical protein Tsubulata_017742 [Turnera subulata]|uniref:TF-B3 domain-containing protein n=1 Tax=Turnera subulata TaxID=218843 RepID=A0A9Q0GG48_9ROSI|nr:hypothetical protein Tsubulata_017742 [Turnera subulata]
MPTTSASSSPDTKQAVPVDDILVKPESYKRRRVAEITLYYNCEVQYAVMERAKKVQADLAPEFPSQIKYMLPSHVSGGFNLGLSRQFCDAHLPKEDTTLILEDENGIVYFSKYLPRKAGLSGGWRKFAEDHKLLDADAVVFQLVTSSKFKVYIVRARDLEEVQLVMDQLKLDDSVKQMNPFNMKNMSAATEEMEDEKPFSTANLEEQKNTVYEHRDIELGFDIWDGITISGPPVAFEKVKSFEDFDILVTGLVITPELSKHMQMKYYELCCSQKSFLHEHLVDGLNLKLIAGIIAETINIADAIRASKLATCQDLFPTWEATLEAFGALGMKVSFLLVRMTQLMAIATNSKKHREAKHGRVSTDANSESLQAELLDAKETVNRLDTESETLEKDGETFDLMFQEVAKAPW